MPVFNINDLSKPSTSTKETDTGNPYSFQEWKARHINIDPNAQIEQYNTYLKNWYKTNAAKPSTNITYIKQLYVNFLKELGLTARNSEEQQFFSSINYDDDVELQTAVTFYARKLKDVSRYLAERRNSITNAKLKYNGVPEWDSIGHMTLMSSLEETFNISIDTDDIVDFSSYEKGKKILKKYKVML